MKPEIIAPISQAVATFAGAVFVLVGIWYREQLDTSKKSKSARIQIGAEVRALLDLIELNGFIAGIQTYIDRLKAGKFAYLNFYASRNFMAVYQANLENLGYLEAAAPDVVRFYMILNSVLEEKDTIVDIGRACEKRVADGGTLTPDDFATLVYRHEVIQAKIKEVVRLGEKVCHELNFRRKNAMKVSLPKSQLISNFPHLFGQRRKPEAEPAVATVPAADVAKASHPTVH